ncbi:MAG: putative transposase [Candidatus Izimaplasma bacterium HR2]|nr:MAG: putative transposase [Candidatus Izimaplasma bacterium HR2]
MKRKGYKYRIYPNNAQKELINKTFGSTRKINNLLLNEKEAIYELFKDYPELLKSHKYLTPAYYKTVYPYLKEVDSQALTSAWLNLQNAFKNFFTGSNKYPRYKSKKNFRKTYTTHTINNNIRWEGNGIKMSKLGIVKLRKHRELPENSIIKAAIISKSATNKYYVSLRIEYEEEIININNDFKKALGLDFSLNGFYVDTEGKKANYPMYYMNSLKKLAKEQRKLSRKVRGSKNYYKQKLKVAIVHEKISFQRNDFLHKLSRKLANSYDIISIETLDLIEMMKNKYFSKKISDISYNKFVSYLSYKCEDEGKILHKVDKYYASSKICSLCGLKKKTLPLSQRTYSCECGNVINRDHNAAINIATQGMISYLSSITEDGTASIA